MRDLAIDFLQVVSRYQSFQDGGQSGAGCRRFMLRADGVCGGVCTGDVGQGMFERIEVSAQRTCLARSVCLPAPSAQTLTVGEAILERARERAGGVSS